MRHPYLFFSAADPAAYRERRKTDPAARARYEKATEKAEEYLAEPFVTWEYANGSETLHANFGGRHVHFGDRVYANFNLTLVDDTHIYVGDGTMFAPNVVVATAAHPILPSLRERGLQYNKPVRIGKNCWIGAGAILLPGVTVGENSVIGAGSVVTGSIPAHSLAAGNPCRVIRTLTEEDRMNG